MTESLTDRLLNELKAERLAHTTRHDWTPRHDQQHDLGELAEAAAAYAAAGSSYDDRDRARGRALWPFESETWKPRDYRRNLIKAGALLLAELERLEHLAESVKFCAVEDDYEIYAARDEASLRAHLTAQGLRPEAIWEVPPTTLVGADETGEREMPVRDLFLDLVGTRGGLDQPFQLTSSYH